MFRFAFSRSVPRAFPTLMGVGLGASAVMAHTRPVFAETVSRPGPGESIAAYAEPVRGKGLSHFDGKLDYHQLTFGSFAGMVSGYCFGRISKLLVGIIVSSLLTTEYLSSAGYLDLKPFYSNVYHWCLRHWNQEILVNDPSFKYSFSLAFVIAAYNA